jgi:hypothetical protein
LTQRRQVADQFVSDLTPSDSVKQNIEAICLDGLLVLINPVGVTGVDDVFGSLFLKNFHLFLSSDDVK